MAKATRKAPAKAAKGAKGAAKRPAPSRKPAKGAKKPAAATKKSSAATARGAKKPVAKGAKKAVAKGAKRPVAKGVKKPGAAKRPSAATAVSKKKPVAKGAVRATSSAKPAAAGPAKARPAATGKAATGKAAERPGKAGAPSLSHFVEDAARGEIRDLTESLAAARADARAARDEVVRLQGEAERLRAALDDARDGSAARVGAVAASGGAAPGESGLRARISQLETERDRLHEAATEARTRAEHAAKTWREQVERAHAEASRNQSALAHAQADLERTRQELARAVDELGRLRAAAPARGEMRVIRTDESRVDEEERARELVGDVDGALEPDEM